MAVAAGSSETRFDAFNRHTIVYKTVNGHNIEAETLISKTIEPGSHPLIVQFHGGGLFSGKALFSDWFPQYLVSFTLAHSAIIVSPNYRLLPESNGADILSDLSDFWTWLQDSFPAFLASKSETSLSVDFDHVLVAGESAGGWMALQSVALLPAGFIKAMHLPYPMSQPLPGTGATEKFGMPVCSNEWLDTQLSKLTPGTIVSAATPPARFDVGMSMIEHGRMTEFLGTEKRFNPYEVLNDMTWFPRTWVIHGKEDNIVSVEYSEKLVEKIERIFPAKARLTVKPGGHGFDGAHDPETDEWLKDGLEWVAQAWL